MKKRQDLPLVIFDEKMARLTPCDFDDKIARITPCDFDEQMQDLPVMILGEKYCKTYPL